MVRDEVVADEVGRADQEVRLGQQRGVEPRPFLDGGLADGAVVPVGMGPRLGGDDRIGRQRDVDVADDAEAFRLRLPHEEFAFAEHCVDVGGVHGAAGAHLPIGHALDNSGCEGAAARPLQYRSHRLAGEPHGAGCVDLRSNLGRRRPPRERGGNPAAGASREERTDAMRGGQISIDPRKRAGPLERGRDRIAVARTVLDD